MSLSKNGRFAAVTNFREMVHETFPASRGDIPLMFMHSSASPAQHITATSPTFADYAGFSAFFADTQSLGYCSNREAATPELGPGIYGLSNGGLDAPWQKLLSGKRDFANALHLHPSIGDLFAVLADSTIATDDMLPNTGLSLEKERLLSSRFIVSPTYGTRNSTVLLVNRSGQVNWIDRTFKVDGFCAERAFQFHLNAT